MIERRVIASFILGCSLLATMAGIGCSSGHHSSSETHSGTMSPVAKTVEAAASEKKK